MSDRGGSFRHAVTIVGAVVLISLLSSCQINLTTTVNISENGSGTIVVTASADEAAVSAAPELITSLNLDDIQTAGWSADTQSTPTGAFTVTLRRNFSTTEEATFFLAQLSGENGPLRDLVVTRSGSTNDAIYQLNGVGGLPQGLSGFADSEALVALGGAPFAAALANRDNVLEDVLAITFVVTMPGTPLDTDGVIAPRDQADVSSTFTWQIPVDQSAITLSASARARNVSAMIATYASRGFLALMILLVVAIVLYIATIVHRRSGSTPAS